MLRTLLPVNWGVRPPNVMLRNTEAYVVLRQHSQQMLDFAVLVCTATPQLKHALEQHAADPTSFLAKNSTFPASEVPYSTEKRAIHGYTSVLGATLQLSIFSYFETYFFSVFDEIVAFHGGSDEIEKSVSKQLAPRDLPKEVAQPLNTLRTRYKAGHIERYRKFSHKLKGAALTWPSQRFMLYGLKQAIQQRKRWKSADIPNLAADLLGVPLTQEEIARFHSIRADRNKIAHGKSLSFDLRKAIDAGYFLRNLALKIDGNVVRSFFIVERYAH